MANQFVERLRQFAKLGKSDIRALEAATNASHTFKPRNDLIREGDQPGPVLVMLDGWAFRYKVLPDGSRRIMAFLMPGDACDLHLGMLTKMDHSIQTLTEAKVARIDGAVMGEMMAAHPAIARAVYVAQLAEQAMLRAWIAGLGRRSSIESLAHLLLELCARRLRNGNSNSSEVQLPLSQLVLADALGSTPVHINRLLQKLRGSGAVELERGNLRIQDLAALSHLSGLGENYLRQRVEALG